MRARFVMYELKSFITPYCRSSLMYHTARCRFYELCTIVALSSGVSGDGRHADDRY